MNPAGAGLPCPFCHGTGRCASCSGTGLKTIRRGMFNVKRQIPCRACEGFRDCQLCHGRGWVSAESHAADALGSPGKS
jgi:DnaJ-class molecular chaperone